MIKTSNIGEFDKTVEEMEVGEVGVIINNNSWNGSLITRNDVYDPHYINFTIINSDFFRSFVYSKTDWKQRTSSSVSISKLNVKIVKLHEIIIEDKPVD